MAISCLFVVVHGWTLCQRRNGCLRQSLRGFTVTKERYALHPLDALDDSVRKYPGGHKALAARLCKTESTLRKELTQGVDTHRIGYEDELSKILFCLEAAKVDGWDNTLHTLAYRHSRLLVPIPDVHDQDDDELVQMVCAMVKEVGDVGVSLTAAKSDKGDGKRYISTREFQGFDVQVEEAMAALAVLRERVREEHQQAKKVGLVK